MLETVRTAVNAAALPTRTIVMTVEEVSAAGESVGVPLNGADAATLAVPARATQQTSLPPRLASPLGSTVTVEVTTTDGRRVEQAIFAGGLGTVCVGLGIGWGTVRTGRSRVDAFG